MPANSLTIPAWNAAFPPLYDIHKTYLENAEEGPFFEGIIPKRIWPSEKNWFDFLGFQVASPIGVPAGPLLNSKWTSLAAELGYDILCYKTIRNFDYAGHNVPNIVFVESDKPLIPNHFPTHLLEQNQLPDSLDRIGITNSFGMPSRSPSYLRSDIPKANQHLKKGQILIVSIVGTPPTTHQPQDFIENFVETALLAKECGAKIIEANFSCPNVVSGEGCIYYNPKAVFEISSQLVKALKETPLILKVGLFPTLQIMSQAFSQAAKAGVRGISGINTISMKVMNNQGQPALGQGRLTSGICGSPIRQAAVDFVREARKINDQDKLGLTIIGTGGATLPEHLADFLNAGADIAMTATGMMWDPYLALRYHESTI